MGVLGNLLHPNEDEYGQPVNPYPAQPGLSAPASAPTLGQLPPHASRLQDAIKVFGATMNQTGLATRKYTPALATGIATAGIAGGNAVGLAEQNASAGYNDAQRSMIEQKIGVPYDFFLKLSDAAQQEILKNAGIMPRTATDMAGQPSPALGGISLDTANTMGGPPKFGDVPMSGPMPQDAQGNQPGRPQIPTMTNPGFPPLQGMDPTVRAQTLFDYANAKVPQSPLQEALTQSALAGAQEKGARATSVAGGGTGKVPKPTIHSQLVDALVKTTGMSRDAVEVGIYTGSLKPQIERLGYHQATDPFDGHPLFEQDGVTPVWVASKATTKPIDGTGLLQPPNSFDPAAFDSTTAKR
jgi:hypothetical protein